MAQRTEALMTVILAHLRDIPALTGDLRPEPQDPSLTGHAHTVDFRDHGGIAPVADLQDARDAFV